MDEEYSEIVGAHNDLIRAKRTSSLSQLATKIELLIIKNFNDHKAEGEFTLSKKDLLRCGTSSVNYRRDVIRAFDQLSDFKLEMSDGDGGIIRSGLASGLHLKKNGDATFSYYDKIKPFLQFQNKKFCKFSFNVALGLTRSEYAAALYAYLESFLYSKDLGAQWNPKVNVEDMRGRLCPGKYSSWSTFEAKVIKPAVQEIDNDSNLSVKYKAIKTRNKYTHLQFFLERQSWQPQLDFYGEDDAVVTIPQEIVDICEGDNGIGFRLIGKNNSLIERAVKACSAEKVYHELESIRKKYNDIFAPKMVNRDIDSLINFILSENAESKNLKALEIEKSTKQNLLKMYDNKLNAECDEYRLFNSDDSIILQLDKMLQEFLANSPDVNSAPFIKIYVKEQVKKSLGSPSQYMEKWLEAQNK